MGRKNKEPPGFYSYRESMRQVMKLSDSDAGRLWKAKYEYWYNGVIPDFSDCERLETMWDYEQEKLDRDRYSYYVTAVKNAYKTYLRDNKEEITGQPPLSIDVWFNWKVLMLQRENKRELPFEVVDVEDVI
ncbi:MAG: hypothetical protein IJG40_16060 [Oscillospiraceae bacterium]|nr:hypothetical protein [Oscillospiraceae bacterium]